MLSNFLKIIIVLLPVVTGAASAAAADLPLATGSPLAGFTFDDRPLVLPPQQNFQMAMLTASSELGRSCGKMEAYGWRMSQTEQRRVDDIFNTTVDRLRGLGYSVEAQTPASVSRDITMFTADKPDKHFIFMWSAGEIGLVMVLCESSPPLSGRTAVNEAAPVEVFPQPNEVLETTLETPVQNKPRRDVIEKFTPVGDWVGSYICEQGYTGATLQITSLRGENFEGVFRFYPTPKNPYVASGRYRVYGQYDRASQRILINPGKWLERPKNYYNTIMVGSFDPVAHTFSAYFQGIMGCTSFEAKAAPEDYEGVAPRMHHKAVKKRHKKKPAKKPAESSAAAPQPVEAVPPPAAVPAAAPEGVPPAAEPAQSIVLPGPNPVPGASAPAASPAAEAPSAPAAAPAYIPVPAPTPVPSAPATAAPEPLTPAIAVPAMKPSGVAPAMQPPPAGSSAPSAAPATAPGKPTGAADPKATNTQTANSGMWFTPTVPQAPQATTVTPSVPQVPAAPAVPPAPTAPSAATITPTVPQVAPVSIVPQAATAPSATFVSPVTPVVPPAPQAPQATVTTPQAPQAPPAQQVPSTGGPGN